MQPGEAVGSRGGGQADPSVAVVGLRTWSQGSLTDPNGKNRTGEGRESGAELVLEQQIKSSKVTVDEQRSCTQGLL